MPLVKQGFRVPAASEREARRLVSKGELHEALALLLQKPKDGNPSPTVDCSALVASTLRRLSDDPYAALKLPGRGEGAALSDADIKRAYRKLALKYHPDRGGQATTAIFQAVQSAHQLLMSPTKRREHDRW